MEDISHMLTPENFDELARRYTTYVVQFPDCSIDERELEKLRTIRPEMYETLKKFVYVKTKDFLKYFNAQVDALVTQLKSQGVTEIWLLNDWRKFGSEHWLIASVWEKIRPFNPKFLTPLSPVPTAPRVYVSLDDAQYSGVRFVEILDVLTHEVSCQSGGTIAYRHICPGSRKYFQGDTFHIVASYCSEPAKEQIKIEFDTEYYPETVYWYSPLPIEYDPEEIDESGNPISDRKFYLYFDHKIADTVGYVEPLRRVLKNQPSRAHLDWLSNQLKEIAAK